MIDLLIRNGQVVTPEAILRADIAVQGGKVLAVGAWGAFAHAKEEFDAEGKLVLPGLVDPHIHMAHPYRGELSLDDFYHSTVSAAYGGTTTVIDFAIQWDKNLTLKQCVDLRREQAEPDVVIDFALHAVPTKSTRESIDQALELLEHGITSFKVYMIYREQGRMVDDAILFELLAALKGKGATVLVHAENASLAEFNTMAFLERERNQASDFPDVKPNMVEAEAVQRALYLNHCANGQLYVVHLSTKEGLEFIRSAITRGDRVIAETCPQYLVLSRDVYDRSDGGRFICSPPLREASDSDALWQGISQGLISTIGSDHCGFGVEQKDRGNGDYTQTPHGIPGVETRLALMYTEGVMRRGISINRLIELLSSNPAKVFGLYPQKGALLPGSDADMVIFDENARSKISSCALHGAVDWTPFDGMPVCGSVTATFLRGRPIVEDGKLQVEKGYGKFIFRKPNVVR